MNKRTEIHKKSTIKKNKSIQKKIRIEPDCIASDQINLNKIISSDKRDEHELYENDNSDE
jgi:acyl-[acyl carrier protein]--UDP-N-acetylglucosamine O-acyltransferase